MSASPEAHVRKRLVVSVELMTIQPMNVDTLISVAVVLDGATPRAYDRLLDMARQLSEAYQFIDLLIVGDARFRIDDQVLERVVALCPQSRYLQVDGANGYDELMKFVCEEVIGDVVVATSIDEIDRVDLLQVLNALLRGRNLVRVRRKRAAVLERAAARVVKFISGFDIDPRFLRTLGINRSLLGQLLAQPSLLSYMRFRVAAFESSQETIEIDIEAPRRGVHALLGRIEVIANLIGTAAPRLLSFAAALSGTLAGLSLGFMLYIGLVFLLKPNVAEGWTTLSLAIAFGLFVQTTVLAVICLGVARLFRDEDTHRSGRILNEISSSDLFRSFSALNVERS